MLVARFRRARRTKAGNEGCVEEDPRFPIMKIHPHRQTEREGRDSRAAVRDFRDRREAAETSGVPHNKKQNKKKQLHRFVLLLPCHICQCGVMDDIFKPHVSYKKTERVITKKRCFRNKNKRYFSHEECTFFLSTPGA